MPLLRVESMRVDANNQGARWNKMTSHESIQHLLNKLLYIPSLSFTAEGFIWSSNQYGRVPRVTTSAKAASSAAQATGKRTATESFIVLMNELLGT